MQQDCSPTLYLTNLTYLQVLRAGAGQYGVGGGPPPGPEAGSEGGDRHHEQRPPHLQHQDTHDQARAHEGPRPQGRWEGSNEGIKFLSEEVLVMNHDNMCRENYLRSNMKDQKLVITVSPMKFETWTHNFLNKIFCQTLGQGY